MDRTRRGGWLVRAKAGIRGMLRKSCEVAEPGGSIKGF